MLTTTNRAKSIDYMLYVSCPPLPSGGFQRDYDATKLGKIIQTAKFFFGKVLDEHDMYLKKTCQNSFLTKQMCGSYALVAA